MPRRTFRGWGAAPLTLLFALLAAPTVARGQGEPAEDALVEAKVHFQAGKLYYDKEKFRQAITEFEAGYDLVKKPAFLLNIAQSYKKLGNNAKAREFYKKYVDEDPQSPQRSQVEKIITEIEAEMTQAGEDPNAAPSGGSDEDPFAAGDSKPKRRPGPPARRPPPLQGPAVEEDPSGAGGTDDGGQVRPLPRRRPVASAPEEPSETVETPVAKEGEGKGDKPPKEDKPLLAKPWFWTLVVIVLAGGAAGAYFATSKKDYVTDGTLGNIDARQK